jgi:hypothetical protein
MIKTSISYGFGPDNRYKLKTIPVDIQLAIYKYQLWEDHRDDIMNQLYQNNIRVNAIHLPLDSMRQPAEKILDLIGVTESNLFCKKFVIHPNKGIGVFIQSFLNTSIDAQLCVENFQHRKKKEFRNILYIIEKCIKYNTDRVKVCLDTSHTEEHWFHPHIMPYILKYVSVIHLSNRKRGQGSHLPFNMQNGDLNLVGFVKELKKRYRWKGDIVLEYMPEYHHKLYRNYDYLTRLIT